MFNRFNKRNLTCGVCGRKFNEHVMDHLCAECYEIASIDNMVNDSGGTEWTADYALEVGKYLAAIAKKGGDVEQVKLQNDFIDWTTVPTVTARSKAAGNTKATNGVKAPVTVRIVDGDMSSEQYFRSVLQAFQQLNLPVKQHQKFRVQLKTAGKLVFTHRGIEFHFTAAGF
jgi:hypothetical protein